MNSVAKPNLLPVLLRTPEAKTASLNLSCTPLTAGVGFFTDAYDIFSISIAATMIGYVYHQGGSNTSNQDLGIKVSHSIGTFFGQLLFGFLADHFGRKRMYGIE